MENAEGSKHKEDVQSFANLFNNRAYKRRLNTIIRKKWSDAPARVNELEKFLREKNIDVDTIGTSKEDIEAWIKTIEDCR